MLKKYNSSYNLLVFLALVLISLPYRFYHFSYPILDSFNFRQAQTATFALNFYKYGINLLMTQLDIFGIGSHKYLLLEFPIYEAIVAVFYKLFSPVEIWGRALNILSGYIGAFFLYQITYFITKNKKISLFSCIFFLFVPLNLFYHRAFMIDPTIIAFLLAGSFYFLKYENNRKKIYYFLSIFLLSLGFIQKGLYGPFWLIPIFLYSLKNSVKRIYQLDFIFLIFIPLLVLFAWQSYENWTNLEHGHIFFTTGNPGHQEWNLGTLSDRFSFPLWQFRLNQVLNGTMLKPGLILFLIGLFKIHKFDKHFFLRGFLLSQFIYFFILFRVQTQNYYQLVMIPAISIFMAVGLFSCIGFLKNRAVSSFLVSVFFAFFISKSFTNSLPSFYIDWNWLQTFQEIESKLPKNKPGVFLTTGYDWNSIYSYYLERKLYSSSVEDINSKNLIQFEKDGYSFLILYDENNIITRLNSLNLSDKLDLLKEYRLIYHENNIAVYEI